MVTLTYAALEPLIRSTDIVGNRIRCLFQCPLSGTKVNAIGTLRQGVEMARDAKYRNVDVTLWVREGVRRTLRCALNHGVQLEQRDERSASEGAWTDGERRAAILDAFDAVSSEFIWDQREPGWVSVDAVADLLPDFSRQLNHAPIREPSDRLIMARMLVEIANADGRLAVEERQFLEEFLPEEVGTIESLSALPVLSKSDLRGATSGPVRETMLMLAWTMAFTDEDLATEEIKRLDAFAAGFETSADYVEDMKRFAQLFVLDQAISQAYAKGPSDSEALARAKSLAEKFLLTDEEFEEVHEFFCQRIGLL